jgi:hypothetical protein
MSVPWTGMRRVTLLVATGALAATVAGGQGVLAPPVRAISSGDGISTYYGFDRCGLPSTSEMSYLWAESPWYWYGTYIGGITAQQVGCTFPSASWLNTVQAQGWNFEFIWDGLQAPNSGNSNTFSTDPSTAYNQGEQMASDAYSTLVNTDGVANQAANTVVVDDLESYEYSGYPYQSAVDSFISGWDNVLHTPTAQTYGVYGSSCGSNLAALASVSPVPEFIWGAYYDNNPSTSDLACVPSGYWIYNQRLKQYNAGVSAYGIVVDEDCADGPTSPYGFSGASC